MFARKISFLVDLKLEDEPDKDLLEVLKETCEEATDDHDGSSTATILQMNSTGYLKTLNLGDSGFVIIRLIVTMIGPNEEFNEVRP